ncbi:hypothetical protein [Halobacteriovorax sp. ZH4_bin.1]|uniref:hypothetical protein n=1 Tax=unclassified Halobacteriovorax TaxID=2639665 RepID=UPI00371C4EAF
MESKDTYNSLINFLIGKWDNVSFEVSDGKPIKTESYPETMIGKSKHVITITAHGYKEGKDLTRDMNLEISDGQIKMAQVDFSAEGSVEGNVYYLKGNHEDVEFRFRLYTMGDKYVFHRETWKDGMAQQVDMSYLIRKTKEREYYGIKKT